MTQEEKQRMIEAMGKIYQGYLDSPDQKKDVWEKVKVIAEKEYGIITQDHGGKISFKDSKWQNEKNTEFEKVRKTVSKNKTRILNKIKIFGPLY